VIRSDTTSRDTGWLTPVRVIARLRFSLLLAAVVIALQLLPGGAKANATAVRRLGINWHTFAAGQIWRLVTDVLIQGRPGLRWSILIPFLWVGVAEWHLGWRLTATAYFVTDWLSTVPTLVVLRLASAHSQWSALQITRFDCGSSAAIYGTLATFCASRRGPNAWIGPVLLVQTMVTIWLTNRRLFDVQHLVSIGVGLAIGFIAVRTPTRSARPDDHV
jgi:hypothetical protein